MYVNYYSCIWILQYAVESQVRWHGYDPATSVIIAKPREVSYTYVQEYVSTANVTLATLYTYTYLLAECFLNLSLSAPLSLSG